MKKNFKRRLLSLILSLNFLLLYGCNKQNDTSLNHIHLYKSEDGIKRYSFGEENFSEYGRQYYKDDKYIVLNDNNKELYNIISINGLINIKDNYDELNKISNSLHDYYSFEFTNTFFDKYYIVEEDENSKNTEYYLEIKKDYNWTIDPSADNMTGKYTINSYVFYGYKIIDTENGYKLEKSKPVKDINTLIENGYEYIGKEIYSIISFEKYCKENNLNISIDTNNLYIKTMEGTFIKYNYNGFYNNRLEENEVIDDILIKIVHEENSNRKVYLINDSYEYDKIEDECEYRLILK